MIRGGNKTVGMALEWKPKVEIKKLEEIWINEVEENLRNNIMTCGEM